MTAMDVSIDLGPMPEYSHTGFLAGGLRGLWQRNELCDVKLVAGGQTFLAHRPVLAAVSPSFHECLLRLSSAQESSRTPASSSEEKTTLMLKLSDISHPEAVQAMLECIYGVPSAANEGSAATYNPSSDEVNRDVLRLAHRFQIAELRARASGWLTSNLSTANVLQRLVACEECDLPEVRSKILEQITANPQALFVLANDPEVRQAPAVLQELLVRVLRLLGCDPAAVGPPAAAALATTPAVAHAPPAKAAAAPPKGQVGKTGKK